jgi:hypothetical protein
MPRTEIIVGSSLLVVCLLSLLCVASRAARNLLLYHPARWLTLACLFVASRAALGHYRRTRHPASLFRARRITDRPIAVRMSRRR